MKAETYISDCLATAQRPAVFVSFGKDSLLLLHLARQARPDITIYHFADELSEFAEQFIIQNDLTVYSYAPADRYLVPNGEGLALIDEYALNDTRIPVVTPIVSGADCRHGIPLQRTPSFRFPHDLVLWGYKCEESCEAVGTAFPKEMLIGGARFVAPLYEMTDADVYQALETLGIPFEDERNEMEVCDDCLNAVISADWDRDAALAGFRSRHNFNH